MLDLIARDQRKHQSDDCPLRPVPCQYCFLEQPFVQLTQHEMLCQAHKVECPLRCGAELRLNQVEHHCTSLCPNRPVACPLGCGAEITMATIEEHTSVACPLRRVTCKLGCGEGDPNLIARNSEPHRCLSHQGYSYGGCKVQRQYAVLLAKDEQKHYQNDCPNRRTWGATERIKP